uniref:G-protein coupled receptors family 3 profile domain-containing protein n=1 Tax=Sus scrofa TaxID=9823 RepID=A0A8D1BHU1_PIG
KNYQCVLAFLFAIEEINKNPHLLPNRSLGYDLYNALESDHKTLENALFWFSGGNQTVPNYNCHRQRKSLVVFTGTASAFSAEIGTLLEPGMEPATSWFLVGFVYCCATMGTPTYGPFDPFLSGKDQFPSLYQMASKDSSLIQGLVWLLLHFGWAWVALLFSDDREGEHFLWDLKAEMLQKGICVFPIPKRTFESTDINFLTKTRASFAKVHIIHGDEAIFMTLNLGHNFYLTLDKVWILVAKCDIVLNKVDNILNSFHRSLSFSLQKREIPGFEHFLKTCPTNSSLQFIPINIDMITMSDSSYIIYNAVYSAQALHELFLVKTEMGSLGDIDQEMLLPWKLHQFLDKIQFLNSAGEHMSLDEKRHHMVEYDILNVVSFPGSLGLLIKVGKFGSNSPYDQSFVINEEMMEWPIGFEDILKSVCSQSCSSGFRKIPQEGRAYLLLYLDQEYPNRGRNRCLPKVVTFLAYEDSLGMALVCMALCFSTCILKQVVFGAVFTVAVATVLAKTLTMILAFKELQLDVIPICFQVIICGVWLGTSPPFLEIDTHSKPKSLIIVCNKGSATAFYSDFGYLGSLALRSFSLAFLARSLPDTFNEAKFLTFSMLVFCTVWVTFIPVYHSTKGKVMVAVEIFSILASSAGLLGCIFAPKCYIILRRPDENSLKALRNQIDSKRNRHSGFIS